MLEPQTRKNLALLSIPEVTEYFASLGHPAFRAKQILRWIWKEGVDDFEKMTNVSKSLRETLARDCVVRLPKIVKTEQSDDGTIKYLLMLDDFRTVETVWIPRKDQDRVTVCVSSQVGCKMGCTFCLTAQQKTERNLTAGEIAAQLLVLPNRSEITNVVLMGMGEPFDNYDNVMAALDIMTDPEGLFIGPKRITVSTSGLVPAIEKFAASTKARLAISLNAPNDEIRNQIMPINRAYPLAKLMEVCRKISSPDFKKPIAPRYFGITFEYILIRDLNDQPEHAMQLVKLIRGFPSKINLLLYNENPNIPFKRPTPEAVYEFQKVLSRHRVLNFVRNSRGRDISAACGQLASEHKRTGEAPIPRPTKPIVTIAAPAAL